MNDDDLLRDLLTNHLPDPPSTPAPTGLRRRAARRATAAVVATTVGVFAAIAVSTVALAARGDEPPAPADPFAQLKLELWHGGFVTSDDRMIIIEFESVCDGARDVRVDERPDSVRIALVGFPAVDVSLPSLLITEHCTAQVMLAEPLAGRVVIDAAGGVPRTLVRQSRELFPTYPLSITTHDMNAFDGPPDNGLIWQHHIQWDKRYLRIAQYEKDSAGGRVADPAVREVPVRGHLGTVYVDATNSADPSKAHRIQLGWTEGDQRIVVGIEESGVGDAEAMLAELLKVADGLR